MNDSLITRYTFPPEFGALLAEFNRGVQRAARADRHAPDDRPLTIRCLGCGRMFAAPQGLGAHRRFTPACKEVGK